MSFSFVVNDGDAPVYRMNELSVLLKQNDNA